VALNRWTGRRARSPHVAGARRRSPALLACLLLPLLACASAEKRFEQGLELESQGAYVAAAERYVQALEKDPQHHAAREHLIDVGQRAITGFLDEAASQRDAGQPVPAADAYRAIQSLVRRAATVDVALTVPAAYASQRREALAHATQWLFEQAAIARKRQQWREATGYYRRIEQYEPDAEFSARVRRAWARTELDWGRAELDIERYHSAFDRAESALAVLGDRAQTAPPAEDELRTAIHELRATALELGTLVVGFIPLWRADEVAAYLPDELLVTSNDELDLDHWSSPPRFITAVDPFALRRELHQLGYLRSSLRTRQAAHVGRATAADYVVTAEITEFDIEEQNVKEETRTVARRDETEATITVRSGKRRYRLRTSFTIVDCARQQVAARGDVLTTDSLTFEEGIYDGVIEDLQLSDRDRDLFDVDQQARRRRALEEDLAKQLADELADRVYDKLTGMVR
jgi:hypothetical protein